MKTCAISDQSAAWAKASGEASSKVGGGHPVWVYVDGTAVTDDSSGTDYWAGTVLTAICKAATAKGLTVPVTCSGANASNGTTLVTPL